MGRPKKEVSQQNIKRFRKELELAGNRSDILLKDKKGRSTSCLLCKRRKQKCDQRLPSCTACLKAAVKCIQPAGYHKSNVKKTIELSHGIRISTVESIKEKQKDLNNIKYPQSPFQTLQKHEKIPSSNSRTPPASLLVSPTITESSYGASTEVSLNNSPLDQLVSPETSFSKNKKNPTKLQKQEKRQRISKERINRKEKNSGKDQYTIFLEKKLRYLEKLIELPIGGVVFTTKLNHYKKITHLLGDIEDLEPTVGNLPITANKNLIQDETLLNQNKFKSPTWLNIPNNSIPVLSSDSLDSIDFNDCIFAKYFAKIDFLYYPAFEFNINLSRPFLDTFFARLQFKYPLLDEEEIYSFHDNYAKHNIYSYSNNEFHFECGRMWLIFSISACMQKTTVKYKGHEPIRYFSTAVRHITKCGGHFNDIQKVELLTLLVFYLIRTDRDSLVLYDIMKDIMNICKKKLLINRWIPNDPFAFKKLRLFWCVYLLERMICEAVSKPFTINEADINLPFFNEDTDHANGSKQIKNVYFINQSLKLRRLESRFIEDLQIFSDDNKGSLEMRQYQLPKVNEYFKQLELWRATCSTTQIKNFENETLKLYYYRSVRLLIQPYLEFLKPEDKLFRECQAAAGQICQLYKIFQQKTIGGHSTPAIHTVFEAGVTLVYCMWLSRNYDDQRRKELGDEARHTKPSVSAILFSTMDDLRACSVCLYSMTERSKFARIFRDAFDELMNATIGNLITRCGPNSSELIDVSQTNKNIVNNEKQTNESNERIGFNGYSQQDQSVVNWSNNGQISHGIPPAIKRIFGVGQAEEHAGFVEISQVDIEEQREFKKKQTDLEKNSLPKSLAHLLNNEREDSKVRNINNFNIQSDINKQSQQQYVVKKVVNNIDSDWKIVQQQVTHHNPQNYLSSFNYKSNKHMTSYIFPNMQFYYNNNFNTNQMNHIAPENQQIMFQLTPNNIYSNNTIIAQTTSQNSLKVFNETSNGSVESSTNSNEPHLNNHAKYQSSVISNLPKKGQHFIMTGNGVLINNWTHNMINNISNWANDYLINGTSVETNNNTNVFPSQSQQATQSEFITKDKQLLTNNPNYKPYFPSQQSLNLDQNNDLLSRSNSTSSNKTPINNTSTTHLSGIFTLNSIPTSPQFQQPNDNSATLNNIHPNTNYNSINNNEKNNNSIQSIPDRYIQVANTTSTIQPEKFWTVNDDYGFLT